MKNIVLLLIFTVISIYIGFFAFDKNEMFFIYGNYVFYFISITFFIWAYLLIDFLICNKSKLLKFIDSHKSAIFTSGIFVALFFFISPPEYRILADEANLLSTSKSLYEKNNVFVSIEEIELLGEKQYFSFSMDKRLVFFPYVLHLIHCIKGYSPNNVYIVNAFASFGCLFFIYFLIQRLWGKYYGYIALLLLASYPLFIRYSMSAGYDVFNLFCALFSFYIFCLFCKNNSLQYANLLIYSVALLSYTRYECSIIAIIVLFVALIILKKEELGKKCYVFCVYPLLFIPNAWIMFFANTNTYLQVEKGESVFSLDYLINNLSNAFYFFLELDSRQETVFIIALMAILSVFLLLVKISKNKLNFVTKIKEYKFHLFIIGVFLFIQIIIKFSYKFGDLTIDENARFGMTILPYIIFMAIFFIYNIVRIRINYKKIIIMLLIFNMLQYWAKTQNNFTTKGNGIGYLVFKHLRSFIGENFKNKNDFIVVSDYSNYLTPLKYNSISIETLNKNFALLKGYIKENKYWNKLIVVQILENGIYEKECVVNKENNFEVIYEKALKDNRSIRYSVYK